MTGLYKKKKKRQTL